MSGEFTRVCALGDLPPGGRRVLEVGGIAVLVCNDAGQLHAVAAMCSHALKPLAEGRVRAGTITCPVHGARFNLQTGKALCLPATKPIAVYDLRCVDDWIEVRV